MNFICPVCSGALQISDSGEKTECSMCHRSFPCAKGIPQLFWPNEWEDSTTDVTDIVKAFYEKTPFPNYENFDSAASLREKAEKSIFAHLLDRQIPHGAKILEVGCGTGQFSNFLGTTWGRTVFGADMCMNSLALGEEFRAHHKLDSVKFVQMNLFRPVFQPESFDLVICNGVLHHTSDPFLGFQSLSKLVRKNGHILIGLYNTYGRLFTKLRSLIFRFSGNNFKFLDSRLRDGNVSEARRHTWFMDQYKNPHESTHTIGEVLDWFDKTGFEFVHGIPRPTAEPFSPQEELFKVTSDGTSFERFLTQLGMVFSGIKEGGFFTMIGRKK